MKCIIQFTLQVKKMTQLIVYHHHLPPWIRSFDLFQHQRVATFIYVLQINIFEDSKISGTTHTRNQIFHKRYLKHFV
jgi:hypothetical protein